MRYLRTYEERKSYEKDGRYFTDYGDNWEIAYRPKDGDIVKMFWANSPRCYDFIVQLSGIDPNDKMIGKTLFRRWNKDSKWEEIKPEDQETHNILYFPLSKEHLLNDEEKEMVEMYFAAKKYNL